MQITFINLFDIDEKLYTKAILTFLTDHLYHKNYFQFLQLDKLKINIYPVNHKTDNPLFWSHVLNNDLTNQDMPHGNTGLDVVNLYIFDTNYERHTLMNFSVITHELCHAIGLITRKFNYVTYVHQMQDEGRFRTFWVWHKLILHRFRGLDITDKTDLRNLDKPEY
jgi:hypothetical protein